MPPVYYPFKNAVTQTDRTPLTCPLLNQNGYYTIDFARFEQTIIQERVKAFILCSPHNPVGRIWKKEELCTILQICKDYGVFVISDEIHHDLEMPGYKHIPSMSAGNYSDILFTLFSASKTFNLAGFQSAILIIENPDLRERFDDFTCRIHLANGNSFGYAATTAAYEQGSDWLSALKEQIVSNYRTLSSFLSSALPQAVISPLEGTYLAWVDLRPYLAPGTAQKVMQEKCHLAVDYGDWFGGSDYDGFIRINLATSHENIVEMTKRLSLITA